jgi:hypothetical protein
MRQHRWPHTANPHVFLTKHTGRRTEECSKRWIWLTIGSDLSIAAIREDRILARPTPPAATSVASPTCSA